MHYDFYANALRFFIYLDPTRLKAYCKIQDLLKVQLKNQNCFTIILNFTKI
jgi:hypothetical protein